MSSYYLSGAWQNVQSQKLSKLTVAHKQSRGSPGHHRWRHPLHKPSTPGHQQNWKERKREHHTTKLSCLHVNSKSYHISSHNHEQTTLHIYSSQWDGYTCTNTNTHTHTRYCCEVCTFPSKYGGLPPPTVQIFLPWSPLGWLLLKL